MKKIVSIILSTVMLISLCTFVSASPAYDVNKAMEYAANHVNDNDGSQCAEFVSKCVQAGGLSIPTKTGTKGCWDAILTASRLSGENLTLNEKGYVNKSANENLLSRGDVVIQWCYTCDLRPHILICGGYDSEGYATFYAHNSALNNKRYNFSKNSQHKASCNIGAKVVQLSKLSNNVPSDGKSTPDNDTKANDNSLTQKCGDSAYWTLDDNGVLTISGSGTMYDFDGPNSTPWASKQDKINHIVIEDMITNIGEQSFSFCNNLYTVDLGKDVQEIGAFAFNNTKNLKEIIIPETLSMLREYSFGGSTNIYDIYYRGKESDWKSIIKEEGNKGIVASNIHYNSTKENLLSGEQALGNESDLIAYGKCGKDINWNLKSNGILTVDGNGAIEWYQPWSDVPWYPYAAKIKHVVFGDGITEINQTLFFGCNQIKSISFGNGIKEISNGLLFECDDSVDKILIGKGIKTIGYNFKENVSIYYAGSESEWNNINFFDEVNESAIKIPYPISFDCSKLPGIDSFIDDGIQVIVKNSFLIMDQSPIIKDGRTLVPLRAIFEALNTPVEWNGSEQKVTATKGTTTIWLTIGDTAIHINDKTIPLDVPAQVVNGRTLIPVRAVAEALNCTVNWNGNKKYVIIVPKKEKKYRIDAVNTKGEVLSSAHFNAEGLVESIDNFGYFKWFLPCYANINGNFYLHDINLLPLDTSQIQFEYQNGNLSKITTDNTEINYKYDSNNRVISNGNEMIYINNEIKNNGYVFKENILGLVNEFYPENEAYLHHDLLYDARGKITTYEMNTDLHTYEYKDDGSLYCSYYQEYTPGEATPYKTKEKVFYKYIID